MKNKMDRNNFNIVLTSAIDVNKSLYCYDNWGFVEISSAKGMLLQKTANWRKVLDGLEVKLSQFNFQEYYLEMGGSLKDYRLERYHLPCFAKFFYMIFADELTLVSPKKFVSRYVRTYCETVGEDTLRLKPEYDVDYGMVFSYQALALRILRAYPSLVREVFLFLDLACKGVKVRYDFLQDMGGVDLTVTLNGHDYGIATYVESRRSLNDRERKKSLHIGKTVELPACFKGEHKNTREVGDFSLYDLEKILEG